jgi:uncharacterized protein (TIGR02118 family)
MIKRMSLLHRRSDLSKEAFSAYWAGHHAAIARDYPGLAKYTQNHVIRRLDPAERDVFETDGMAELWFSSEAEVTVAMKSSVAPALVADEPNFLAGVTGMLLTGVSVDDGIGGAKVIVLARRKTREGIPPGSAVGLLHASVSTVSSVFKRDALAALTTPPDTILTARFIDPDAAVTAVATGAWPTTDNLEIWHAYQVKEFRIV